MVLYVWECRMLMTKQRRMGRKVEKFSGRGGRGVYMSQRKSG